MKKILKKYYGQFNKIGKKEKLIIFSILIAAFVIGIVGSYAYKYIGSQRPSTKDQKLISPAPLPKTALLTLMTDDKKLSVGKEFDVTLRLNSGNLGVEAADFVVNFDPDYVKVASVSTGTFFKNYPINTTGDNFVKISGVADFTEKAVVVPKGEGNVATVTFETLSATESTRIGFDKVKTIIASSGQNILDTTNLPSFQLKISE